MAKSVDSNAAETKSGDIVPCGVVMPISEMPGYPASHWEDVLRIIKEGLKESRFQVDLVSENAAAGIILDGIIHHLADDPIVICDVSARNANVMFELGVRLAFNKATVIIKDDLTSYPFDTSPLKYIEYPRDLRYPKVQKFQAELAKTVAATYEASQKSGYKTFLEYFGRLKSTQELPTIESPLPQILIDQFAALRGEISALRLVTAQGVNSGGGAGYRNQARASSDKYIRWHVSGKPEDLEAFETLIDMFYKNQNYFIAPNVANDGMEMVSPLLDQDGFRELYYQAKQHNVSLVEI